MVRVERTVIIPDTGVIAADELLRAAVILSEKRVQERFPGTRVTHVERVAGVDDGILDKIVLDERIDGTGTHARGDVSGLEPAEQRVNEHAVAHLDADLGEILVGAMHGIAGLKRRHFRPAALLEHGADFGRGQKQIRELLAEKAGGEHAYLAPQIHVTLFHHHAHTRVIDVGGPEYGAALVLFVDGVFLAHGHGGKRPASLRIDERHVAAFGDTVGGGTVHGQSDGDGPEDPIGHAHVVANAAPILISHEALEGSESADAHHHDVAHFTGAQRHSSQIRGAGELGIKLGTFEEQRPQRGRAVGTHEFRHGQSSIAPPGGAPPCSLTDRFRARYSLLSPRTLSGRRA